MKQHPSGSFSSALAVVLTALLLTPGLLLNLRGFLGIASVVPPLGFLAIAAFALQRRANLAAGLRRLFGVGAIGLGVVYLPACIVATMLDIRAGIMSLLLAGALTGLLPRSLGRLRLAFALLPVMAVNGVALLMLVNVFHLTPDMELKDRGETAPGVVVHHHAPSHYFRFLFNDDSTLVQLNSVSRGSFAEVRKVPEIEERLRFLDGICMNRYHRTDLNVVLAIEEQFAAIVDSRDLRILKRKYMPTDRNYVPLRYAGVGIGYHPDLEQILLVRGNGDLYRFSFPDFNMISVESCLSDDVIALTSQFETVFDATLGGDRLLVRTMLGELFLYNVRTREVEASQFLWGPLGNPAYAEAGDRFYISSFLLSSIFEVDAATLEVRSWHPMWLGVRYLSSTVNDGLLVVSDYFRGTVSWYDLERRTVVASMNAGPRIQRVDFAPGKPWIAVSHAAGFTLLDSSEVVKKRIQESPLYPSPFSYLHPRRVKAYFEAVGFHDSWAFWTNLNVILIYLVALGSLLWRTNREERRENERRQ